MRNPVKAGICHRAEDYRYSSMSMKGLRAHELPVSERVDELGRQIPKDIKERIGWLNEPTTKESDEIVRRAMRRTKFQFSKGNDVRKAVERIATTYKVKLTTPHAPEPFPAEK